jgi:benzoyl-CoA 2,3-epoxidase subunit A
MPGAGGRMMLFFGARTPKELPYFGPLQKVPDSLLEKHLVFSRIAGERKEYVQDRLRTEIDSVSALLGETSTHIFICGLKGMETGVDEALADICRQAGRDWSTLKPDMRTSGRYHVETY